MNSFWRFLLISTGSRDFPDEIPADEKEGCNPQNIEQQEARPLTPDQRDTRRPVPQKRQALISFGGGKDKDCAVIGVSLIPLYREDRALNDRGGDGAHRRIDSFLQGLFPRPVDERLPVLWPEPRTRNREMVPGSPQYV